MCRGETTFDMGPGSANCTPAAGMGGVEVIVGVRVARLEGVFVGPVVFVALGVGLVVADGLYANGVADGLLASAVELFCVSGAPASMVGVVEAVGGSVEVPLSVGAGSPVRAVGASSEGRFSTGYSVLTGVAGIKQPAPSNTNNMKARII